VGKNLEANKKGMNCGEKNLEANKKGMNCGEKSGSNKKRPTGLQIHRQVLEREPPPLRGERRHFLLQVATEQACFRHREENAVHKTRNQI
jgi:hypothetical protein